MYDKLIFVGVIIVSVFLTYKSIKNIKILRKTPKRVPTQSLDYFRETPDETASAAEAGI